MLKKIPRKFGNLDRIKNHPGFFIDPASGVIYWRGTINGHRFKKSCGTTKITEARRIIDEFRRTVNTENLTKEKRSIKGVTNPSVEALWNEAVSERLPKKAKSTAVGYSVSWRLKIKPFWGNKNLSDINTKNVIAFENWYLKEFPGTVFFNTRKHFQMLLNYLHREGYIAKKLKVADLDAETATKEGQKKPFRIYPDTERDALYQAIGDMAYRQALVIYFNTGARKMEILSVEKTQVNLKANRVSLWSSKNKKWRDVPLTKAAHLAFKNLIKMSGDSPYLFPMKSDPSRHISSQLFDKAWSDAKKRAGIKGRARVHDIRHTFATKTAIDGWPIPVACKCLDMSPDEYIKTYVHVEYEHITALMKKSFEGH